MCFPIKCDQCNKIGWGGCGAHVAQVMANVPEDQRCKCRENARDDRAVMKTDRRR